MPINEWYTIKLQCEVHRNNNSKSIVIEGRSRQECRRKLKEHFALWSFSLVTGRALCETCTANGEKIPKQRVR